MNFQFLRTSTTAFNWNYLISISFRIFNTFKLSITAKQKDRNQSLQLLVLDNKNTRNNVNNHEYFSAPRIPLRFSYHAETFATESINPVRSVHAKDRACLRIDRVRTVRRDAITRPVLLGLNPRDQQRRWYRSRGISFLRLIRHRRGEISLKPDPGCFFSSPPRPAPPARPQSDFITQAILRYA